MCRKNPEVKTFQQKTLENNCLNETLRIRNLKMENLSARSSRIEKIFVRRTMSKTHSQSTHASSSLTTGTSYSTYSYTTPEMADSVKKLWRKTRRFNCRKTKKRRSKEISQGNSDKIARKISITNRIEKWLGLGELIRSLLIVL